MICKLKKNTWGPNSPLFLLNYKDCVMITNLFDFGIFSHMLRHMGIYWVWVPVRVFEMFRFLFLFFSSFSFFFSFLFFIFFFCLSLGAPLAPGPLDIVHPCHPVATPLTVPLAKQNRTKQNKNKQKQT